MLVNIHFQKWPLQFFWQLYIYDSDKGSGTEIKKTTDDQDKDGFKLENVGPTFSSFAVVTH